MRSILGGVEPAVQRSDAGFDPTAKYHIGANIEYLRYFAARVFQCQFHKALCIKARQFDESDPKSFLDNCDIYGSTEAGEVFKEFLSVGSSKNWRVVLEKFTGDRKMSAKALLDYFKPLRKWLQGEIKRLDITTGWQISDNAVGSKY
uniref:Angiotensin-converting enzyme n=1 Tax=Megaselia scalaris TaxID=36166 RepID=T1GT33_MEGSC